MSTKEQSGMKQKTSQQQKSKPTTGGLEQSPAQAEAVAAAQKVLGFPRPPLDPDDVLALQRTAGNRVVHRLFVNNPDFQPFVWAPLPSFENGSAYERQWPSGAAYPSRYDTYQHQAVHSLRGLCSQY